MSGEPITATGVITGFDSISFTQSNTTEQLVPSNFSLADIKCYLEQIRDNYSETSLNDMVLSILGHTQDFNNPHHVTLAQLGVDILQAVYQSWLQNGNTGTETDFLNTIFQITPVASDGDFSGGTSSNLVTVAQVTGAIATHNADPNAHTALINTIIPGTPPGAYPTFAMDARVGIPNGVTVTNSTGLTLIDRNGNLTTVAANTLGIDYSTGGPTYPLYGPRTNTIFPSAPLSTPSGVLGATMATASSGSPVGSLQVGPDKNPVAALTENAMNLIHGYEKAIAITNGTEYTSSVFIYPLNTALNIVVYIDAQTNASMVLNLQTMAITTYNGSVIGYAQQLRNGWIRLGLQYVAASTTACNLVVATTPATAPSLSTGSYAYTGTTSPMFGIFGLSHVAGAGMSPYIPTTTAAASHDNTIVSVTAPLANLTQGIIALRYNVPQSLVSRSRYFLTTGGSLQISEVNANVQAIPKAGGVLQSTIVLPQVFNELVTTAFSYAVAENEFITTGSQKQQVPGQTTTISTTNTVTLTFGNGTYYFDGALRACSIYPVPDTNLQLEFLCGEVLS